MIFKSHLGTMEGVIQVQFRHVADRRHETQGIRTRSELVARTCQARLWNTVLFDHQNVLHERTRLA